MWFTVASLEDAVQAVESPGGKIVVGKTANPVGHYVVAEDPQGARVFLFEPGGRLKNSVLSDHDGAHALHRVVRVAAEVPLRRVRL